MGPRCTLKRVIARQIVFSEQLFPSRHLSGMQFSEVEASREAIRGATRDRGGLPTRLATSTVKKSQLIKTPLLTWKFHFLL